MSTADSPDATTQPPRALDATVAVPRTGVPTGALDELMDASDAFALYDASWRLVAMNRALRERAAASGEPPERLIGRTLWSSWPELVGTPLESALRAAVEDRTTLRLEIPARDRPGAWTELRVVPMRDAQVGVFSRDATAERTMRDEVSGSEARFRALAIDNARLLEEERRARHATEAARSRLAFLASASELLSSSLDHDTTIRRMVSLAVPGLADWAAYDVDAGDGTIRTMAIHHVDPAMEALAARIDAKYPMRTDEPGGVAEVLRTGQPLMIAEIPEELLRAVATDEEHYRLLESIGYRSVIHVPLVAQGRVLGALCFATGDSGRTFGPADLELAVELARRAAVAIDHARLFGDAQAANESKAAFLATMSHELRTPLNAIMGYADLLQTGVLGEVSESQRKPLQRITTGAHHLVGMVDEILTFSRLEAERETLALEHADATAIARTAAGLVEPVIASSGLGFELEVPTVPAPLTTDVGKVRQVLVNLLSNATKFTERGSVALRVRPLADGVAFEVRDTGIGIAPENLERIFESFWQVDQSATRRVGGTGLGLTVSRRLAEFLGGELTVESLPGQGSTFRLTLPRTAPSEPPDDGG